MNEQKRQLLIDVERIARESAAGLGLEIVEFVVHGQGRHTQLRIDIDRPGSGGVGLADCEELSRALDVLLDDLPLFESTYELQVSSPGIDRPIRTDDDVRRNTGRLVRVAFRDGTEKIQEVTGTLIGLDGPGKVRVGGDRGELSVSRDAIVLMKQDVTAGVRKRNR